MAERGEERTDASHSNTLVIVKMQNLSGSVGGQRSAMGADRPLECKIDVYFSYKLGRNECKFSLSKVSGKF